MPEPGGVWTRTWETLEAVHARAMLFAQVVPRSVAASRAAAARDGATGIPAWELGVREFSETALDELFIAISAVYREVPPMERLRDGVESCRVAAAELGTLDPAAAHRAPPPMRVLGLRRVKAAGQVLEHLEYESDPLLPEALAAFGHGGRQVAHARILRHDDRHGHAPVTPRPWLVLVHGAEQGRTDDLWTFRAAHLHHDLGYNVAMPVLPAHGPRRALGHSWPALDTLGNVATMLRAVSDVRALCDWVRREDPASPGRTAVLGMSLGGPVAAMVAGLEPSVSAVVAMVPMMDANATIAHHVRRNGRRGRALAALLSDEGVRACGRVVDPLALTPYAAPERRLVIAALGDRMTSVQAARRLHEHWGGQVHWHHGGHVGHLFSGEVRGVVDDFLRRAATQGALSPR